MLLPFGADLRLHTYGLLQGLAAYPFVTWLGVAGAFNLVLIATLWLNGLAVYALIYDEVRQSAPALIAAVLVILGTPALVHFRVGRPSFAALWIIALALLTFRRLLERPTPVNAIALGLLLLAALLGDFQMLFYTGLWLGLYSLYWMFCYAKRTWAEQGGSALKLRPLQLLNTIGRFSGLDHKRLLNGMIARLPGDVFAFYRAQPALLFLSGETTAAADGVLRGNLTEVLSWSQACYLVLHTNMLAGPEGEQRIVTFLDTVPAVRRYAQEADLIIYLVNDPPNCPEGLLANNF